MPRVKCPACNYCLEGAPSTICPECGTEWTLTAAHRKEFPERLSWRERLVLGLYAAVWGKATLGLLWLAGWRLLPLPGTMPIGMGVWEILATLAGVLFAYLFCDALWSIIRGEPTSLSQTWLDWWESSPLERWLRIGDLW